MTLLIPDSAADAARRRDRLLRIAEGEVADAIGAAMRRFLRHLQRAVRPDALTASVPRPTDLFTLGQAAGWWEAAVDAEIRTTVGDVWRRGYRETSDGDLVTSSLAEAETYLANVTDRLSRTARPTIPEQAMDTARVALSEEMTRGSSIRETSKRLASEFSWDVDATAARNRLERLNGDVDSILDAIGPPGTPAREAARLHDPRVAELQRQRASAVRQIDATQSTWQTRADRIARTETTGAYNAGSLQA
ncbi:MAG: hypothetical protein ABR616_05615, partial [Dermatophilaceae bacterium]